MILKKLIFSVFLLLSLQITVAQQNWLNSLEVAKSYARNHNKLILMVWSQASKHPFSGIVKNNEGKVVFVENIYTSAAILDLFWKNFIPVIVDEEVYQALLVDIEEKRNRKYIDLFNDNSLKIMDANGNIIGTSGVDTITLNLSEFILKYSLDTSYLKQELINYNKEKNFYSSFYLASKYIDYSVYVNKKVRPEILKLAKVYFDEAKLLLKKEEKLKYRSIIFQRIELTILKQDLINGKANKVLKSLKKISKNQIENSNQPLFNFLYYTAYRLKSNKEEFSKIEKYLSLFNKRQSQHIIDINR